MRDLPTVEEMMRRMERRRAFVKLALAAAWIAAIGGPIVWVFA